MPVLSFKESSYSISKCSNEFVLDIIESKGMTSRNLQSVSWTVLSVAALTTSTLRNTLNTLVSTSFSNLKYVKFDKATISSVAGKVVEIKVNATNFLSKSANKTITLDFLSYKKIIIEGIYATYYLVADHENKFFVSARIPTCDGDNVDELMIEERAVTLLCQLYKSDGVTLVSNLTQCTIPANKMALGNSYKIKFSASNPYNSSMNSYEWSDILINSTDIEVYINGGNRKISLDTDTLFTSNVEPKTANMVYYWTCHEADSKSF